MRRDGKRTVAYGCDGAGVAAQMRYDAAGNLVRHELAAPDGTEMAQDYEMGPHNELLRIRKRRAAGDRNPPSIGISRTDG